ALLMAALAFVTVFLAAALPRVSDRGANAALRDYMSHQNLNQASLQSASKTQLSDTAAALDAVQQKLTGRIGKKLTLSEPGEAYGTKALADGPMDNPGYARLSEAPPSMSVMYLHGLADRVTLTDGTWPGSTPAGLGEPLPVVMSRQAAETIGVKLGDTVDNDGGGARSTRRSLVVGLYRANDPQDPFWADLGCPDRACLHIDTKGAAWWQTTAFVDGANVSALALWGSGGENFWRLPVDSASLRADQLGETRASIASFQTGPGATALVAETGRRDLRTSSDLTDLLNRAEARYRAAMPLSAIGPAGVAGVAVVVLCLAAALSTDRRSAEIRLLRARGGSRGGVLLWLLGEGVATVLPAAVLGLVLALVLLPTPRWGYAVLAALAATLLALLAFPVRAALLWSRERAPGGWRRVVGEAVVLAVTVAAVVEVRRHGVGRPGGDGMDPLLVAAPLLLAVSGGLVLARVEPVVVGWLAAAAGRGRGLVGFLGLARAARDTSGRRRPSVLPLLALLIAVTSTGFGSTVLDTVDGVRTRAARISTGGDVSVVIPDYATLSESFTKAAAELPGVRSATGLLMEPKATFIGGDQDYTRAALVVAEPNAYAAIARSLGVGEFDPAKLAGSPGGRDTPVPALFSRDLAKRLAAGPAKVRTPSGNELATTVAGIITATPALPDPGTPFVVVPAGPAAERIPELKRTNKWIAVGDVDPDQLRTTLLERGLTQPTGIAKLVSDAAAAAGKSSHGLPPGYTVHSSRERADQLGDDPLQQAAGSFFWYAAAAAAGFALLAVLLTLFRAAPDRAAVLARLRTMGLRPRQGLALIIAEALPQALTAAVGGGLVAVVAVALLGPAFNLSTLVGAQVRDALTPALMPVLLPTGGLALLVVLAVVVETLVAGRRHLATELRAGEQS
ncbi:hypothetical protein, partial [Streptomyces sp. FH025]|uniref:hypothetical protein n=1 Tax=Streptomyces sp. FH025 TaxID=2815937 RepID=UPI001A9CEA6A